MKLIDSLLYAAALTGGHAQEFSTSQNTNSDVCVIGGGSAGTYAAVRLQQMGQSVTLIEKQDRLGGHVNTYVDPTSGQSFDYGVIEFENSTVVSSYFQSLGIELGPAVQSGGATLYADFQTGEAIPASSVGQPNPTALGQALATYEQQLAKYPYLVTGFNLPDPVPEDLLISFGDFVTKYQLEAIVNLAFQYFAGVGNVLDIPMLYFFKYLNQGVINGIATNSFVTTAEHNNQGLYDSALRFLGSSVLLNSNVTSIMRHSDCLQICVSTPEGERVVEAKKLVIAIPPLVSKLSFLDLDSEESAVFSQFTNTYYWDALVRDTGLPDNTSVNNLNLALPYDLPASPETYGFGASPIAGIHTAYYNSNSSLSDDQVQAAILADVERVTTGLGYPSGNAELVSFNAHNPYEVRVSADAIKDGFYGRLEALQGRHNTWYTGAAWQAHDSGSIWNFTETMVLPQLVA